MRVIVTNFAWETAGHDPRQHRSTYGAHLLMA